MIESNSTVRTSPAVSTEDSANGAAYVADTTVGLLDALHDAMTLARPGQDCAAFAGDLRRLGDGAAYVAQELEAMVAGTATPARPAIADQTAAAS
ncbi:MAG: hypothetical protein AAF205_07635 [Pseudomonadota bacterium]